MQRPPPADKKDRTSPHTAAAEANEANAKAEAPPVIKGTPKPVKHRDASPAH